MIPLRLENLNRQFAPDALPAVDQVSLQVLPHEVFTLIGPSGCGKTTLLRMIAGFESPDAGRIYLGDELIEGPQTHISPDKRRIGLVFQELALFPHLDVLHNVSFGLHHLPRAQRRKVALEVLDLVGIVDLAQRKPHELSGGQQQRVALARSMAPAPAIILLDEPFSSLDPALRADVRGQVRGILKKHGMSALLVTHDQDEALSFADRIGVMNQGKLLQVGAPDELYRQPRTAFVAQFLGRTNLIPAQAHGHHADTPLGHLCLNADAAGDVLLSIRPEHLRLSKPQADHPVARILSRQFKGHDLTYQVELGGRTYLVQTDWSCPFRPGEAVSLGHASPAVIVAPDAASSDPPTAL